MLIVEHLPYPFYVIDINNYKNETFCYTVIHGYETPCDQHGESCPLKMVKRKKDSVVVEHQHYDEQDECRYYEVRAHPVFN